MFGAYDIFKNTKKSYNYYTYLLENKIKTNKMLENYIQNTKNLIEKNMLPLKAKLEEKNTNLIDKHFFDLKRKWNKDYSNFNYITDNPSDSGEPKYIFTFAIVTFFTGLGVLFFRRSFLLKNS